MGGRHPMTGRALLVAALCVGAGACGGGAAPPLPAAPPPPQCSDGVDNDGDGLIDFPQDPGCFGADDDDEFNVHPTACPPNDLVQDITAAGEATVTISTPTPGYL